jgi:hypothetical protein
MTGNKVDDPSEVFASFAVELLPQGTQRNGARDPKKDKTIRFRVVRRAIIVARGSISPMWISGNTFESPAAR